MTSRLVGPAADGTPVGLHGGALADAREEGNADRGASGPSSATLEVRRGPLAVLLASAFVNMLGSSITLVALPLITLALGGGAARLGLVGSAETAAGALGVVLSGPLVDRVGPRRLAVGSSLVAAALLTVIPLAAAAHRLGVGVLAASGAAAAFTAAPGLACRQRLVASAARAAGMAQEKAGALYWIFPRSGIAIGAFLAAVLLERLGADGLIWCDSASFVLSAAMLPGIRARATVEETGNPEHGGYFRGLVDGIRALTGSPVLRTVCWTAFVLSAADGPRSAVIAPLYLRECHAPQNALAWMIGAYTAGSLGGLSAYTVLIERLRSSRVVVGCLLATAAAYAVMAAATRLTGTADDLGTGASAVLLGVAGVAIMGAAQGPFLPILVATVYKHCPAEAGSAALSALLGLTSLAVPIGILAYGAALAVVPLWGVLVLSAVLFAAACGPVHRILPQNDAPPDR